MKGSYLSFGVTSKSLGACELQEQTEEQLQGGDRTVRAYMSAAVRLDLVKVPDV